MGTRSVTVIRGNENRKIVEIYQQYAGQPTGVGKEIKDFIASAKMVNGIGGDEPVFNGVECFAAQFIAKFKTAPGGLYLHVPTDDHPNVQTYNELYDAEYYYEIDQKLNVKCWDTLKGVEVEI